MATEEGNDGGGVDRISSLPDDLIGPGLRTLRPGWPSARTPSRCSTSATLTA